MCLNCIRPIKGCKRCELGLQGPVAGEQFSRFRLDGDAHQQRRRGRCRRPVIATLKRDAGVAPGQKEPASVERLRVAQRSWLVYRDTECRRRNRDKEGPLWAPMRARCLAEFSGDRTDELAAELAKLRAR